MVVSYQRIDTQIRFSSRYPVVTETFKVAINECVAYIQVVTEEFGYKYTKEQIEAKIVGELLFSHSKECGHALDGIPDELKESIVLAYEQEDMERLVEELNRAPLEVVAAQKQSTKEYDMRRYRLVVENFANVPLPLEEVYVMRGENVKRVRITSVAVSIGAHKTVAIQDAQGCRFDVFGYSRAELAEAVLGKRRTPEYIGRWGLQDLVYFAIDGRLYKGTITAIVGHADKDGSKILFKVSSGALIYTIERPFESKEAVRTYIERRSHGEKEE